MCNCMILYVAGCEYVVVLQSLVADAYMYVFVVVFVPVPWFAVPDALSNTTRPFGFPI